MAGVINNYNGIIVKPCVECIYQDANKKTHTKYYRKDQIGKSKVEFEMIAKKGLPVRRQGYLNGSEFEVEDSGDTTNFDEMALTAMIDFGSFKCRYLIRKYVIGLKTVYQPTANRTGVVEKIERKSLDELEEERIEYNFDRHYFLEDRLVK